MLRRVKISSESNHVYEPGYHNKELRALKNNTQDDVVPMYLYEANSCWQIY